MLPAGAKHGRQTDAERLAYGMPMTDFAARRVIMVDTQVRPSDVTRFPLIAAMLDIPRERYVPGPLREAAYVGENLEFAPGRVLLDPRTLAKMLDALDIQPHEAVLDLGCGPGYSAAVIARLAEAVVAVEDDPGTAAEAEATLLAEGVDNVAVIEAPLHEGSPRHGPFDVIVIEGGVERLPEAIGAQLREGGRIGCLFMQGALGQVGIGRKAGGVIGWRMIFHAAAPVLPGFAAEREFVL
jgi:protein-L-isoaspartate(D-aspartate) O-methyltransferase